MGIAENVYVTLQSLTVVPPLTVVAVTPVGQLKVSMAEVALLSVV